MAGYNNLIHSPKSFEFYVYGVQVVIIQNNTHKMLNIYKVYVLDLLCRPIIKFLELDTVE